MMLIDWEKTNTFCEGNEGGTILVASNEVRLVVNAEVKGANIYNTQWGKQVMESLNIW